MSAIVLPDHPTGQQLVDSIHELAAQLGQTPAQVARSLTQNPHNWLKEVARARAPKAHTIERVRQLLAGQAPAAPRTYERGYSPVIVRESGPPIVRPAIIPPAPGDRRPQAFSREPCPRCATRGDLGCDHQAPFLEEGAAHERTAD